MHFDCPGGCGGWVLSFLLVETQKRSKMKTATQMLNRMNPSCPSCIPPFLKLHSCFPVDHPTGLTRTLCGLTDATSPRAASGARAPHLSASVAPGTAPISRLQVPAEISPPQQGGITSWISLHGQQQESIFPPLGRALDPALTKRCTRSPLPPPAGSEVQVQRAAPRCCFRHSTYNTCNARLNTSHHRRPRKVEAKENNNSFAKKPESAPALALAESSQLHNAASAADAHSHLQPMQPAAVSLPRYLLRSHAQPLLLNPGIKK